MEIYNELFRDDLFVYVQLIDFPEVINKKISLDDYNFWRLDKIER